MSLTNLNIGDSVTVFVRGKANRIEKVTRKTKTMIVTSGTSRFNINTGITIPNNSFNLYSTKIKPTTKDDRKSIRRDEMINKLLGFPFNRLSYEQLENVLKAISGEVIK